MLLEVMDSLTRAGWKSPAVPSGGRDSSVINDTALCRGQTTLIDVADRSSDLPDRSRHQLRMRESIPSSDRGEDARLTGGSLSMPAISHGYVGRAERGDSGRTRPIHASRGMMPFTSFAMPPGHYHPAFIGTTKSRLAPTRGLSRARLLRPKREVAALHQAHKVDYTFVVSL